MLQVKELAITKDIVTKIFKPFISWGLIHGFIDVLKFDLYSLSYFFFFWHETNIRLKQIVNHFIKRIIFYFVVIFTILSGKKIIFISNGDPFCLLLISYLGMEHNEVYFVDENEARVINLLHQTYTSNVSTDLAFSHTIILKICKVIIWNLGLDSVFFLKPNFN